MTNFLKIKICKKIFFFIDSSIKKLSVELCNVNRGLCYYLPINRLHLSWFLPGLSACRNTDTIQTAIIMFRTFPIATSRMDSGPIYLPLGAPPVNDDFLCPVVLIMMR